MWSIELGAITQLHHSPGPHPGVITLADLIELGRRRPRVPGRGAYQKYDNLVKRFQDEMNDYLDELIAGKRSPYGFQRGMQAAIRAHYPDAYGYGQQVLDPKAIGFDQEDLAAIKAQQQREFGFLKRWYDDLKAQLGGPYEKQAIEKAVGWMRYRVGMYSQALRTLFFQGQVSMVGSGTLIYWNLWPPAQHCIDCPGIAAGSPYTKDTLPTLPGHDVACMRNCKCFLTFGLPATLLERAMLQADPSFLPVLVQSSYLREFHHGSGPHPGTGTPQSVHGKGRGITEACRAPKAPHPMLSEAEKAQAEKMHDYLNEEVYKEGHWVNATHMERSVIKAQVARQLAEDTGMSAEEASDFVNQWAKTSNDNDMRSLAIQRDASEEFGAPMSEFTKGKIAELKQTLADPEVGKSLFEAAEQRALLRAMYERTQADLKARGITEVRLYRGADYDKKRWFSKVGRPVTEEAAAVGAKGEYRGTLSRYDVGKQVRLETNTISSWSVDVNIAEQFGAGGVAQGRGRVGVVLESIIPAERILSTPYTGFGCLSEGEIVVLGGGAADTAIIADLFFE